MTAVLPLREPVLAVPALELRGVSKVYGSADMAVAALSRINVQLQAGQMAGLLGVEQGSQRY